MGKGNFILGTGSSSIGDVTFARRNGQQIARVRVRKIKNPKSYGQAEQRMISAEVVKFYSPLSGVLETSFEGLSKSESYAKFLSINMNLARANGWAVKKGSAFVALPFQLSAGILPMPEFSNDNPFPVFKCAVSGADDAQLSVGAASTAILQSYPRLQTGDQVTFISFNSVKNELKVARIFLDTTSEETSELVTKIGYTNGIILPTDIRETLKVTDAMAVIFSRWDTNDQKWARSTSFMHVRTSDMANYTGEENYAAAVASYMNAGGRTPVSNVYLNGHDDE